MIAIYIYKKRVIARVGMTLDIRGYSPRSKLPNISDDTLFPLLFAALELIALVDEFVATTEHLV